MVQTKEETMSQTSWPSNNLGDALALQAKLKPEAEAVVCGETRINFATLNARSLAVQEQLNQLGIVKNDMVGVLFHNHPDFIAIFFAIVKLGAVVVPINPMLKSSEIAHILSDSGSKAIIVHELFKPEVVAALPQLDGLEYLIVADASSPLDEKAVRPRHLALTKQSEPQGEVKSTDHTDPDKDLALLVYTSGTTGKPKGAMLSHRCVMSVFPFNIFSTLELTDRERIIGILPMCHIYGIGTMVCTPVALGCTVVIMQKFEAKATLECMAKEKITMIPGVPAMYQFMLMEYEQNKVDLPELRYCLSAAAPIAPEVIERIQNEFGAQVVEGYGMSETAGGGTVNPPKQQRTGSIGKSIPEAELAILDDNQQPLPLGKEHVGEIAIKGGCVMLGYHNQPEATKESVNADGWLLTGDLGCCDEEGYFYIVGRKKELIIRGGQNIYPRELEECILRMDGVQDVAVIGIPDEMMGERVKAFVVAAKDATVTEESVKEFCAEHLAAYKVPRLVEFVSELPRNSTGKLLKRLLK